MELVKLTYVEPYCSICGGDLEEDPYLLVCGEVKAILCGNCCPGAEKLLTAIGHQVSREPYQRELSSSESPSRLPGWRV